ncbi:hypothetical protein AMP9_2161 [plant metagenome]|uniref:Uncharacterized protein n=1 Tax=plant metagenome TaxID=1297885 RepID=A0A484NSN3_9ZZZZ
MLFSLLRIRMGGAFLRLPRRVFVKCFRRSSANENYYQMTGKHNSLFFSLQADEHYSGAACLRRGAGGQKGGACLTLDLK